MNINCKFQFMCKPSAEGKLVFTMPRRSQKSDIIQLICYGYF